MGSTRAGSYVREAATVAGMVALTLTLPVAIYGCLSWWKFDYFSLTSFVPYEAMKQDLASPTVAKIIALPLVEMNMTSGHILANMYTLTLGQFVLSSALGLMIGLVIAGQIERKILCGARAGRGLGSAAGAGTGLLATVAAASTGLLGCCGGSAFAGGVFALAGLGSGTAAILAQTSPLIQLGLILVFVALYVRLRRARLPA